MLLMTLEKESLMQARFDSGIRSCADFLKSSIGDDSQREGSMQANYRNLYGMKRSEVIISERVSSGIGPRVDVMNSPSLGKFKIGFLRDRKETIVDRDNSVQASGI